MKELILLLGRRRDPHILGILNELRKVDEKFVLLDNFSKDDSFSIRFNGHSSSVIKCGGRSVNTETIKSIWNYSSLKIDAAKYVAIRAREFVLAEWTEGISSLWKTIPARWVNDPVSIDNASNRLGQLQLAAKLGLEVPKTLITTDPLSFQEFYEKSNGGVVAKTLHSSLGLPEGKMIYTTKMSHKDVRRAGDLRYAPCMFQEYVPKKTEFRVTIVGQTLHTAEIYSQQSQKTKDDWRRYDDFRKTPYVRSRLPGDVEEKLLRWMKRTGLEFGAADLIRTPDDRYIFLEVNPNGRWWWVQELTGMNIAKSIAEHLRQKP